MFERFTDTARQAVVHAQEEARQLRHNYIGTEHLLLGLIRESHGVAAKALTALGVSVDDVRRDVQTIIGRGTEQTPGHIPFTPRAKKVLELAVRETQRLNPNYVGTQHILFALIRESDGVAAQVLLRRGIDANNARQQVTQLLSSPRSDAPPTESPSSREAD